MTRQPLDYLMGSKFRKIELGLLGLQAGILYMFVDLKISCDPDFLW